MVRISKAAMETSLERIRAKIIELEAKIADLRIAEREIKALEELPARKIRPAPGPKPRPKRKPEASNVCRSGNLQPLAGNLQRLPGIARHARVSLRDAQIWTGLPYLSTVG
jgi:hypothetical protein